MPNDPIEQQKCPCCEGKGTVENQREKLLAQLTAACIGMAEEDYREVEFYATYLRTRRAR